MPSFEEKLDSFKAKLDATWKESDHPRAEDGKFGSGGGGKTEGGKGKKPSQREIFAAQNNLRNSSTAEWRKAGWSEEQTKKVQAEAREVLQRARMHGLIESSSGPSVEQRRAEIKEHGKVITKGPSDKPSRSVEERREALTSDKPKYTFEQAKAKQVAAWKQNILKDHPKAKFRVAKGGATVAMNEKGETLSVYL